MASGPLNYVSVCAGAGGLDLAVGLALPTARCVCYVEREAGAVAILASRMQDQSIHSAPVWSDLRTFDGGPWRGVVDLVVAGIPCQGNSLAGKRQLERDERNLWPDLRRVLREVGCRFLFLENVLAPALSHADLWAHGLRVSRPGADRGELAAWLAAAAGAAEPAEEARVAPVPLSRAAKKAVKRRVRRLAHGMARRLDELRACGNGVVPLQGGAAFVVLAHVLGLQRYFGMTQD